MAETKSRILYILKYLWQNTDAEHYATTGDILTHLKENGISCDRKTIPGDIAKLCDKVTSALNVWHNKTNDKFGFIEDAHFDKWLDFYKPFAYDILKTARGLSANGKLESKVLFVMESAWDAFDIIFTEEVEKASLIHGDMNVMNILADKDLNLVAVIDPLESKWADKEYELFQLRNLTGDKFGLYDMYKKKYPVSKNCDIKTAFYALYHEVYCYIISGNKVNFILMPLVKRMKKELEKINK